MLWGEGGTQDLGLTIVVGPKFIVGWAINLFTLSHMIFSAFLAEGDSMPGIF
jgi:hypothetical protein